MQEEVETFTCSNCGAALVFDITSQQLKCPHCDTQVDIPPGKPVEEMDFLTNADRAQENAQWERQVQSIRCESCGSEMLVPMEATALVCPYCGSAQVLAQKQQAGIAPNGVIPFKVTRDGALEIFRKWIGRRFWAPGKLKTLFQQDKLDAIYLPYWTFDANADAHYTAEGGRTYTTTVGTGKNKRTVTRVRWYPVSGHIRHWFDDILVPAGQTRDRYTLQVDEFETKAVLPFSTAYLTGFRAEKYTTTPDQGFKEAKQAMHTALVGMAEQQVRMHYDRARNVNMAANFYDVTFKHILAPIWNFGFFYQGKMNRVVINAQTGRIHGSYPLSRVKIAIAVTLGVLAAVGLLILYLRYGQ